MISYLCVSPKAFPKINILKYNVYSYLCYGAKGILYFCYQNPFANGYHYAASDYNDNGRIIYNNLKTVNSEIKFMGPELLKLQWVTTIHGSSIDPNSQERDLPTLTDPNNLVIEKIASSDNSEGTCCIGTFKNESKNYIMVMNKDIEEQHTYTIDFKSDNPNVWKHNKTDEYWTRQHGSSTSLELTIKPGDMELIALCNPGHLKCLSPIIDLLLLDEN